MKHKDNHKHGHPGTADPEGKLAGAPAEGIPAATETPAACGVEKPEAPGVEETSRQPAASAAPQPSEEEAKLRDRLLRLQADFDNYRKRIARDHVDMVKRANEDLVESLLPVLDHFGHAEASMEKDARSDIAAYLEGFRLVRNELVRVLESFGVKPIKALGRPFDASQHDALSLMPSETAEPGTVLFETRKGYTLNGRVLRPAQVIVVSERQEKAAAEPEPAEPEAAEPESAPADVAGTEA